MALQARLVRMGKNGLPGVGGKDAYELFLSLNPTSTLSLGQWMQSLKGDKGDNGA